MNEEYQYNRQYYDGIDHYNINKTDGRIPYFMFFVLLGVCLGSHLIRMCSDNSTLNTNTNIINEPLIVLKKKNVENTSLLDETCTICLDNYEKNDEITELDCGHIYHYKCIYQWVQSKKSCPLCRFQLF